MRTISFTTQPRPDASISYQGGHLFKMTHRLSSIDVRRGSALVARYNLVYYDETGEGAPGAHANGRSLLYKAIRFGADGATSLPARTFSYSGATPPAYSAAGDVAGQFAAGFAGVNLNDPRRAFLDVNGDAAADAVFTSSSDSTAAVQLSRKGTNGQHGFWPPLDANAAAYAVPLADADGPGIAFPDTPIAVRGLDSHWVDYTGDSRPDLMSGRFQYFSVLENPQVMQTIMCDDGTGGQVPCEDLVEDSKRTYRNVGWNWVDENSLPAQATATLPAKSGYEILPTNAATIMQCGTWTFIGNAWLLTWVPVVMGFTKLVDLDGDGLADLLEHRIPNPQSISCDDYADNYQSDAAAWRALFTVRKVFLNQGGGWQSSADAPWSSRLSTALDDMQVILGQVMVFDLNGDGFADFGPDEDGDGAVDAALRIYLGTGDSGTGWVQASSAGYQNIPDGLRPLDIDGDGLLDHLAASPLFNTGSSFVAPPGGYGVPSWFGSIGSQDLVSDLDGDGLIDHVHADGASSTAHMSSDGDAGGNQVEPEGILTGIQFAAGGSVTVAYRSSAEGSCYDTISGGCHASAVAWPLAAIPNCTAPFVVAGPSVESGVEPDAGGDLCAFFVQNLPLQLQMVVSTSSDDANGNLRTDQIAYDGGAYSAPSREHRGFGLVSETPQIMSYTNPVTLGSETVNATAVTRFYQKAFLRGQPAIATTFGMVGGQLSVLETTIAKYFVTRADLSTTYLLQGLGFRLACDIDEEGQTTACSDFFDVQTLDLSFLPSALPFDRFQAGFGVTNPDASSTYLVLNAGQTRLIYDGDNTAVQLEQTQYHDLYGSVHFTIDLGDLSDTTDDSASISAFAEDECYQSLGDPLAECFRSTLPKNLHTLPSGRTGLSYNNDGMTLSFRVLSFETMDYDDLGNGYTKVGDLTRTTNGLGASLQIIDYEYAPSHFGQPLRVSDPHLSAETPVLTDFTYDASETFRTSATRGGAFTRTHSYDPPGAPPGIGIVYTEIDESGAWVTYGADAFGRRTCTTRVYPEGTSPPTGADACTLDVLSQTSFADFLEFQPRTTTVFDGAGNTSTTRVFFDGFGRTIRVQRDGLKSDGAGGEVAKTIVATVQYDVLGRIRSRSRPYFSDDSSPGGTTTYHDERNRLRFAVGPNDGKWQTQYHKLETTEIDAAGRQVKVRRDGKGRRISITEFDAASMYETKYQYDPLGRLRGVCDSAASSCAVIDCNVGTCDAVGGDLKHTVRVQYDLVGHRKSLEDPDLGLSTFAYDGAGRLTSETDANGNTLARVYDGLGRLRCENPTGVASCDPADGADVLYTYGDEAGAPVASHGINRPVLVETTLADYQYQYSAAGAVTSAQMILSGGSGDYTRTWGYDWLGRTTSASYPDGETISRQYDLMGLDRVWSSQRVYVDDTIHNAERGPLSVEYGNGTVRDVDYEADSGALDRLHDHMGMSSVLDRSYDYDLTLKLSSITDAINPEENLNGIQYDGLGRLTNYTRGAGPALTNAYDRLGNLTLKAGMPLPYEHPTKPHAVYDASDPTRFSYDARGNMIGRDGQVLGYDARNRLISVSGDLPTSFTYDHTGERAAMQHGADGSVFFGMDLEIMNGVRFIKTVRAHGTLVARVATVPMGGGQAAVVVMRRIAGERLLHRFALGQAACLLLAFSLVLVWRHREGLPVARAALAGASAAVFVLAPTSIAVAQIPTGDVNGDGKIDVGDAVIVQRIVSGEISQPSAQQQEAGDVAPLEAAPDGTIGVGDAVLLLRVVAGEDVDGDGLDADQELAAGASPFRFDSDGDGLSDPSELSQGTDPASADTDQDGLDDGAEIAGGSNPLVADSDGDGLVDGRDGNPLAMDVEVVHYVHADHLGGTAVLTDTSGTAVREIYFDIWGEERNELLAGAPASTPVPGESFTGQRLDRSTGLLYYGARYYDPSIGRFTQPDPIVPAVYNPQSLNRYAYTLNDPLNRIDPSGNISVGGMISGVGSAIGSVGSAIGSFVGDVASGVAGMSYVNVSLKYLEDVQRWLDRMNSATKKVLAWPGMALGSVASHIVTPLGRSAAAVGTALAGGLSQGGTQYAQATPSGPAAGAATSPGGSQQQGSGGFLGALGKIWNAPNTAIGLLYAGVGRLFGGDFSIGNNAIQLENSPLQRSGFAVTLGNVIVYGGGQATPQAYGPHELQHTIQGQVLGPLYIPANLTGMGASLLSAPFTGISPRGILFGPANFMEVGPNSTPPRPWP